MSNLSGLPEDEFLKKIVEMSIEFKRRFKKDLGITGSYGEVHSSIIWNMDRSQETNQPGFDSTVSGKRIQIKCGVNRKDGDICSKFSSHKFDYLLYVHYDDAFNITATFLLSEKTVLDLLERKKAVKER